MHSQLEALGEDLGDCSASDHVWISWESHWEPAITTDELLVHLFLLLLPESD
jgi:hypothetical protein